MAYITISNSKKMIRSLDAETLDRISEEIYSRDIYFFSKRERANLKGIRELFRDPEQFGLDYYKPIQIVDSLKYVYPEKQPSYHKDNTCGRLISNYKNYEIPIPIKEKGVEEITLFRNWFTSNNCENLEVKEYIYALQRRFPYVGEINPNSIERDNSGVQEKEDYTLASLQHNIDKTIEACDKYFNDNPNLRNLIVRYQKWTFLAFTYGKIKDNKSGLSDNDLRNFLLSYEKAFKTPIKDFLIEYYRIRFNPDLDFSGTLLEKLGFNKCQHCLNDPCG